MTREQRATAPTPHGVRTVEELVSRLRQLRAWAGVSYRALHREVVRLRVARGVPERPVYNTVYRCFQPDRTRLDVELVVDIAQVLLGDESAAASWRQACQVIEGAAGAAEIVDVADRLPAELGSFVGRRADLQRLLEFPAVAVIDGMPGVGKTRLAVHAARRAAADIRLAVDLRGFDPELPPTDPSAVLDGFLRCLGVSGDQIGRLDLAGRTAMYRRLLAGRRAVVLLDNAATVEQIGPLLPASPQCVALITSRRRLEIPGAQRISLGEFTPAEVAEFLRTEEIDAPAEQAREIGHLVANLPLALTIVAARIQASPEWTVADHLERLDHQRRTMRLEDAVSATISLSYENLPGDSRRTFLLLGMHRAIDIESYATAALLDADIDEAGGHLDQLHAASLLQVNSPGRYRFHDLVRAYAINRAQDELPASARRLAMIRLLDHYEYSASVAMDAYAPYEKSRRPIIAPCTTPTREFADRQAAAAWLDNERRNLIATVGYAVENGHENHAIRQSETLMRYLDTAGELRDAEILHTMALGATDPTDRVRAMTNLGTVFLHLGRYEEATALFEDALARIPEPRERTIERRVVANLGIGLMQLGRWHDALDRIEDALQIAREMGDTGAEGIQLNNLGLICSQIGRYREALDSHEQARAIHRSHGDRVGEGRALGNIGAIYILLEQDEEALESNRLALEIAHEVGEPRAVGLDLDNIGTIYARAGKLTEAMENHQRALEIARPIGNTHLECVAVKNAGFVLFRQGKYDAALDNYQRALDLTEECRLPIAGCDVLNLIGDLLLATGEPNAAVERHEEVLDRAVHIEAIHQQARAYEGIARAYSVTGDEENANAHRQQALRLFDTLGIEPGRIRARLAQTPTGSPAISGKQSR